MTLDQRLSWMESRAYCQSLGGDLLSVWGKHMENVIITRVLNKQVESGLCRSKAHHETEF